MIPLSFVSAMNGTVCLIPVITSIEWFVSDLNYTVRFISGINDIVR